MLKKNISLLRSCQAMSEGPLKCPLGQHYWIEFIEFNSLAVSQQTVILKETEDAAQSAPQRTYYQEQGASGTYLYVDIHPEWAERPSPNVDMFIDGASWEGSTPRFQGIYSSSAGVSALHTLPFGFNPGDTTATQGIGVCVDDTAICVTIL